MGRPIDRAIDQVAIDGMQMGAARFAAIFLAAGVLAVNVNVSIAATWLIPGVGLEIWERLAARKVRRGEEGSTFSRINFLSSVGAMTLNWTAAPAIFWLTGNKALQIVAITTLAGQLIHAQAFGFRSRSVLLISAGIPSVALFALPTLWGGFHGVAQATVAFGSLTSIGYVALSAKANSVAHAELLRARSAAEFANEAKSAFLAMISHELRTPLNGILGMAQALKLSGLNERQGQYTQTLIACGDDLMLLLNDVLDLSKIEAGKMDLDVKPFDIRQLGEVVLALWAPSAEKKGVRLTLDVSKDVPAWLSGDELRIKQILLNLASNALKFTAAGDVSFSVSSIRENGVPAGVEIAVQDSGIGMSQDQQARLFQDYSQAQASTSGRYGGTGLGLSICRRLCKLMGGEISVRSTAGEGSTFLVRLPLSEAFPCEPDAQPEILIDLAGCRILVVDDNANNRAVAQAILGAMDAAVETAQGAVEALDILRWGTFDLVLTDLHMPDMDGQELARRIRRGEAGLSTVIIVALTGDLEFTSDDFDAVHPKPIQASALLESLGKLRMAHAPDRAARTNLKRA